MYLNLWFTLIYFMGSTLIIFISQSCWGPNAPGGKSASGKMAKQAALAFVKRTLDRCQQFEITGNSCFSEPLFSEMFLSRLSQFSDAQQLAASTDGESGKLYCMDGRASGNVSYSCISDKFENTNIFMYVLSKTKKFLFLYEIQQ